MRWVAGTVSTGGVTVAVWLGHFDSIVLLLVAVLAAGMWVLSKQEYTDRLCDAVETIKAKPLPAARAARKRAEAQPAVETERDRADLLPHPTPPSPRAA